MTGTLKERLQALPQNELKRLEEQLWHIDYHARAEQEAGRVYEAQGGLWWVGGGACALFFIAAQFFGSKEALGPFDENGGVGVLLVGAIAMLGRAWWLKQAWDAPLRERVRVQYGNALLDKLDAFYVEAQGDRQGYLYARQTKEKVMRGEIDQLVKSLGGGKESAGGRLVPD
jgi:hypothetical protein